MEYTRRFIAHVANSNKIQKSWAFDWLVAWGRDKGPQWAQRGAQREQAAILAAATPTKVASDATKHSLLELCRHQLASKTCRPRCLGSSWRIDCRSVHDGRKTRTSNPHNFATTCGNRLQDWSPVLISIVACLVFEWTHRRYWCWRLQEFGIL